MHAAWAHGHTAVLLSANGLCLPAVDDMFWEQPWDLKTFAKECKKEWGVTPRPYWAQDKSVLHICGNNASKLFSEWGCMLSS